jgi:hypothetical protein
MRGRRTLVEDDAQRALVPSEDLVHLLLVAVALAEEVRVLRRLARREVLPRALVELLAHHLEREVGAQSQGAPVSVL